MLKSTLSLFLVSCWLGGQNCTALTVKRGADVTLECSGHRDANIILIRWQRPDLQSDGHVFFFKDGHFLDEFQHDLFKGRVELKDPNWKETGDLSVILQHVTMNDAGTYECEAGYDGQGAELLSRVTLKVEEPALTVKRGADVTLECSGHRDANIILIRWQRPDLQSDGHVFFFKDGHFQDEFQHDLFKGRVELKYPNWKETGDLAVILQHVTMNDAGTYECEAGYDGQGAELLSSVTLKVEKPGQPGGQREDGANKGEEKEDGGMKDGLAGWRVGLILAAVLFDVAVVVGFVYFYKHRNTRTQYQRAARAQEQPEMNSDSHQHAPVQEEQAGSQQQEYEMSESPSEQI